jgi:hypothetical protein
MHENKSVYHEVALCGECLMFKKVVTFLESRLRHLYRFCQIHVLYPSGRSPLVRASEMDEITQSCTLKFIHVLLNYFPSMTTVQMGQSHDGKLCTICHDWGYST